MAKSFLRAEWRRGLGSVLARYALFLAALLALGAQFLIARRQVHGYGTVIPGAVLYVIAAGCAVAAWRRQGAPARAGRPADRDLSAERDDDPGGIACARPLPGGVEAAMVALLILGALWIRVHRLDLVPPGLNNDEAINAIEVQEINDGKEFASLTTRGLNRETMFHHLAAFAFRHPFLLNLMRAMPVVFDLQPMLLRAETGFQDLIVPLRSVAVGAGLLTIVALYLFARDRFGWPVALLSAVYLAVSPWHLLYSRVGLRAILAPLFTVVTVWLFLRARESDRLPDHLAWGAAMGLGFWSFTSFRVVPIAIAVYLMVRRRLAGGADTRPILSRGMIAGSGVAAACLMTLLALSPIGPIGFLTRGAYATLITPKANHAANLLAAFLLPHYFPARYAVIQSDAFISDGVSTVFGLIPAEPETTVVAALSFLGILYAGWRAFSRSPGSVAARRRDPACALILMSHLITVLTVGLAGPSLTRMLVSVPWISLFAALATARLACALAAIRRPLTAWIGAAVAATLVAVASVQGYHRLFLDADRSARAMQHFGATQTVMGMFVRSLAPGPVIYVLHTLRVDSLKYLIGPRGDVSFVTDPTHLDLDAIIALPRTATLIVENARPFAEVLRYLIMRYPQGDMTQVADARFDPDKIIFYTFTLWKDPSGKPMAPPGGGPAPPPVPGAPGIPESIP